MKVYNLNYFIIANVVGLLVFIGCFLLLFKASVPAQSIPIGGMVAGFLSILSGYLYGWYSVDDRLKFFIGLIIAAILIGGSMWLVQRYAKKQE